MVQLLQLSYRACSAAHPTVCTAKPAARLYVKQMWPYWLDVAHEGCVKNDVLLKDEVAILSGPNMAGPPFLL